MIETEINRNDPKTGALVEATPQMVAAVEAASQMLAKELADSDPFEIKALWQFENGEAGPQVQLHLTAGEDTWSVMMGPDEYLNEERLRDCILRYVFDFYSYLSKADLRRSIRSLNEWKAENMVEA